MKGHLLHQHIHPQFKIPKENFKFLNLPRDVTKNTDTTSL